MCVCVIGPIFIFHFEEGVKKYMERWEHFYLPSDHEVVINATILSLNNVTSFQVTRDDGVNLKGGEVVVKPAVYDRHNHITTYSITFLNPSISHAAYTIDYNIDSIDVRLFRSFVITRPRGVLEMYTFRRFILSFMSPRNRNGH